MKITIEIRKETVYESMHNLLTVKIYDYNGQIYGYQKILQDEMFESDFERIWRMIGEEISWDAKDKLIKSKLKPGKE